MTGLGARPPASRTAPERTDPDHEFQEQRAATLRRS
jgi:hypothetical protein